MRKDSGRPTVDAEASLPGWRRLWALAFAIATVAGWSSVLFVYFGMLANDKPLPFRTAVLAGLPDWYFWAALTPPVFWLGRRVRFERSSWPRAAAVHLVAGVAVALLELLLFTAFNHWFYYNPWAPAPAEFADAYVRNVLRSFHFAFLIYWLIVAAAHAFGSYQRERRRELDASRLRAVNAELEARLSRARLDGLRAQLHPHFLFNALNTVSGLIRGQRNAEATDLVAELGGLLRRSLETHARHEVPLREELSLVEAYLGIEKARFGNRLEVRYAVDPALLDVQVPPMVLQPLVENAIRHGLRDSTQGRVSIAARAENGAVQLEVADDGRGVSAPGIVVDDGHCRGVSATATTGSRVGTGLANLKARLEMLYGNECRVELASGPNGGACACVRIPRRPSSPIEDP